MRHSLESIWFFLRVTLINTCAKEETPDFLLSGHEKMLWRRVEKMREFVSGIIDERISRYREEEGSSDFL